MYREWLLLAIKREGVLFMRILVTGGAGYIGSHTAVVLLEQGHDVIIVDNLCNSKRVAVQRVEELSGKQVAFYQYDVCDEEKMRQVFSQEKIDAVIHFAGLKAVGESVSIPLKYYDNNLTSTLVLLKVMKEFGVGNFVFSSSATVYGDPASVPIREDFPLSATNPYGATKLMIERILMDCANADPEFHPVLLRYFNPVGAHESGKLGEDPNGIPNNLVPYITQTVVGKREIMSCGVPASGTFNGNPVGVAAALATLEELSQPGVYQRFDRLGQLLEEGFRALGEKYHRKLYLRHMGSIFVLYFGYTEDVADFRDWLGHADVAAYERFVAGCEDYGVRFTDLRGREYLSTAHTEEDIRRTLAVADQVLGEMAQEGA